MLAVIIDRNIKDISEYICYDSCSDIPLLTVNLLEYQVKELKSTGVTDIIYFGNKDIIPIDGVQAVKTTKDLIDIIKKFDFKNIVLTSSNIYFEFKTCSLDFDFSSVSFTDESGEKCCVLLNAADFVDYIVSHENEKISVSDIFNEANTELKCAENVLHIQNVKEYKKLIKLILEGKTDVELPTIASGVYASGKIPAGDFVIIPPVYFGNDVQIESDCVIGPYTAVLDDCLISKNSYIKDSVLMKETYVSGNCFLDNVFCGENVSVRRDSAIFSGSVLGKGVTVAESTFMENDSKIRAFTNVSEYKNKVINYKENESLSGFFGYSPEKAALLGGALGTAYSGAKIGILCNGEINAQALKYAVVSGLISTGVECFDFGYGFISLLQFYINYCQLDYGVFINGTDSGTAISVINKKTLNLSKDDYYSVKEIMLNSSVKRCEKGDCKSIRQVRGMKKIYMQNLVKNIKNEINVFPSFYCSEKFIQNVFYSALSKLNCSKINNKIRFNVNESGTVCECVADGKKYNHSKLCDFVSYYSGSDSLYDVDLWRNDAVFLCFKVLEIISGNHIDFSSEIENVPSFYLAEKVIETDKKLPYIASKLSDSIKVSFKNSELCLFDRDLKFKIVENGNFNKIKVLARSYRAELANELVSDGEKLLLNLDV